MTALVGRLHAAMNAGKSTHLLQAAFNYEERGMRVRLFRIRRGKLQQCKCLPGQARARPARRLSDVMGVLFRPKSR